MAVNNLSLCGNYQQYTCKSIYSSTWTLAWCYLFRRTLLHPWCYGTNRPSQHISSQGHFLGIKVKHPRTIFIILRLRPEKRDLYKRTGKQRKKLVAFLFPARGEKLGVSFFNLIAGTFGSKVIMYSCDLDSPSCKSLMKSASNSFPMCHLWLDNMMDGPFYSLFHLLCCSKLYFPFPGCFYLKHPFLCDMVIHQGGGSNASRLSGGWGEMHKPHRSFCISSSHCHPACAHLKKTKNT